MGPTRTEIRNRVQKGTFIHGSGKSYKSRNRYRLIDISYGRRTSKDVRTGVTREKRIYLKFVSTMISKNTHT